MNETLDRLTARQAHLEVRAITVQVKPPHERSRLPSVSYQVVSVEEIGGSGDDTEIAWLLTTSLAGRLVSRFGLDSVGSVLHGQMVREAKTNSRSFWKLDLPVLHRQAGFLKFAAQRRIEDLGRGEFDERRDWRVRGQMD